MDPIRTIERLVDTDIAAASAAEIPGLFHQLRQLTGWASTVEAQLARRASELEATASGIAASDAIARGKKSSQHEAKRVARRADALGNAPDLERQLAKGRVSNEHADVLGNAAAKLTDESHREALFARQSDLAEHAAAETPGQFARTVARTVREVTNDDGLDRSEQQRAAATLSYGLNKENGMGWIRGDLHPDDYQRVKRRLDAEVKALAKRPGNRQLDRNRLAATALVGITTSRRAVSQPPPEVMVLLDLQTLIEGLRAGSICEYSDGTPLPVETARRHACNASIIPAVLDSEGMPTDVGRGSRMATPAQRRSLRSMYRTCAVGGCERDFDSCEIHHIIEWAYANGYTDLINLLPLCSYHHHRAHEGRWRLQLDPSTRELSVYLPDGTLLGRCLPDMIEERAA